MSKGKKTYLNLGTIVEKRDKKTGELILDENGNKTYYLKVDKKSKVVINGVQIGDYINVNRPRDKYDRMLASGKITPQEHAIKVAQYEEGGEFDYAKFELNTSVED